MVEEYDILTNRKRNFQTDGQKICTMQTMHIFFAERRGPDPSKRERVIETKGAGRVQCQAPTPISHAGIDDGKGQQVIPGNARCTFFLMTAA